MNYFKYHMKKCFPLVSIYIFGLLGMLLFAHSQLEAGSTMFKECRNCGHWNYQSSNTCSLCGHNGRFEDVYLLPDVEKRDGKKKKAKSLGFRDIRLERNDVIYEMYVTPIEAIIYRLEFDGSQKSKEIIPSLMEIRETIIEKYDLESARRKDFHYPYHTTP